MSEHDDWKRADAFEEALLRSSALDEPDRAAVSRAALTLGVTLTSLAVTSSAAAASAASAAAAPVASSALSTVKTGLGAALWGKPLMIGAALGTVTTGGVQVMLEREAAREARASADLVERRRPARASGASARLDANATTEVESGSESGALSGHEPAALAPTPPTARFRDQQASAAARPPAPSATFVDAAVVPPAASAAEPPTLPAPATNDVAQQRAGSISEQIEVIDRARAALRLGDAQTARAHLDGYRFRWPNGELAIEATVLRIEARFAAGERAAASAEARVFIDAQPNSRYAARLRKLLASEINSSQR